MEPQCRRYILKSVEAGLPVLRIQPSRRQIPKRAVLMHVVVLPPPSTAFPVLHSPSVWLRSSAARLSRRVVRAVLAAEYSLRHVMLGSSQRFRPVHPIRPKATAPRTKPKCCS